MSLALVTCVRAVAISNLSRRRQNARRSPAKKRIAVSPETAMIIRRLDISIKKKRFPISFSVHRPYQSSSHQSRGHHGRRRPREENHSRGFNLYRVADHWRYPGLRYAKGWYERT